MKDVDLEKLKKKKSMKELLEFGIINIDKSSGPTSFNVSEFVKKKLNLRKTSHGGTLDPKVTGVLPVFLNRACKLLGYFLGEDKEYIGIMRLHKEVPLKKIKEKIKEKFIGEIIQIPPVKSRVKRQERPRTIHKFELLEQSEGGKDILFKTEVQGGTYIRKLIDDLGKELKVGAHMLELRRIRAGIFKETNLVNLYDFEKAVDEYEKGNEKPLREIIIPGEIITKLHPTIEIKKQAIKRIFHGSPIHEDELKNKKDLKFKKDQKLIGFSENQFIGIFKVIKQNNLFARSEFTLQPLK